MHVLSLNLSIWSCMLQRRQHTVLASPPPAELHARLQMQRLHALLQCC